MQRRTLMMILDWYHIAYTRRTITTVTDCNTMGNRLEVRQLTISSSNE
jgi:hypothetical protein